MDTQKKRELELDTKLWLWTANLSVTSKSSRFWHMLQSPFLSQIGKPPDTHRRERHCLLSA